MRASLVRSFAYVVVARLASDPELSRAYKARRSLKWHQTSFDRGAVSLARR